MQNDKRTQDDRLSEFKSNEIDLMKKIFEHAPMAIGIVEGPEHRLRYLNKRFRYLYDLESFEEGMPVKELLKRKKETEEEAFYRLNLLNKVYGTGEAFIANEYTTFLDREGTGTPKVAYFNLIFQPLKDESDEVYGLVIAGYEVTEHVKAREQRAISKRRLALALEGANMGFWEIDATSNELTYISKQFKSHFGYRYDQEFTYQDFINALHPEDRQYVLDAVDEAKLERKYFDLEYRVFWPDDSIHWLKARGQWMYDSKGNPTRRIGITIDITRQKITERRLKEAIKLRDDFFSIASHELQTPITTMKVRGQLFESRLRESGEQDLASEVAKINQRIDELSKLTGNLLDISRMQEGKLKLDKEVFDLHETINEAVDALSHISPHQIQIHGLKHLKIYADRFRIEQVLNNLLENAIKYSPETKKIDIKLSKDAEGIKVSVADFGIGISQDEKRKVFERFFKGKDREKNTYPGFGVGLYISNQIIQRHGGTIQVKSNKPRGSVFTLILPDNYNEPNS